MPFLPHRDPRPLRLDCPAGIQPEGLYLGNGAQALEVAVLKATRPPTRPELRALHRERTGKRATPVVLVVLHGDGVQTTRAIAAKVREFGLQPWKAPEPLPPIADYDISLVVRIAVEAADGRRPTADG